MAQTVILDTGPLVAYLDKSEVNHRWAVSRFEALDEAVLTCEEVITEACHLLRHLPAAQQGVGELLRRGIVLCAFNLQVHHERVCALMRKHADTPMSLVDACLMCMAGDATGAKIFTLDSDFRIYRQRDGKRARLIAPW